MLAKSPSILKQLKYAFLGFGLMMGLVFPLYANFFVVWKEGMLLWFCIGCMVAGLTIGIANHKMLEWLLLRKLREVSVASARIRSGDLREGCGVRSADTIGEITEGFDAMASDLRDTIRSIADSAQSVDATALEISSAMHSLDDNMEKHRNNAKEIAKVIQGTDDAASSILALSDEAGNSVKSAGQLIRGGVSHVNATEQAISELDASSGKISANALSLESGAKEVESAVLAIRTIADQTKLIAFNAAIEASSAGEAGRRFAVVADEVRKLSGQAAQATMRIEKVLQRVNEDVASTVRLSEENAQIVRAGLNASRLSTEAFVQIEQTTSAMRQAVEAVHEAADDQKTLVGIILWRIADNDAHTDEAIRHTATCIQEAEQMLEGARNLNATTQKFVL